MSRSTDIGKTKVSSVKTYSKHQVAFLCNYWYQKGYKEGLEEAGMVIVSQTKDETKH